MNRKALIVIGTVVGILILAVVVLPFVVDANSFRPRVESEASAALGRTVSIGKLDLAILHGGVVASAISVSDDPSFSREPFLRAKTLTIGVEMWPLIVSREVHVQSLTVVEPQINLVRSGNKWNFETLGAKSAKKPNPSSSQSGNFSVSNLKVKNGTVSVAQSGKKHTYDDVNIELDNFSPTSVFPFSVDAKAPGGGNLKVKGTAGPMSAGDMMQTPLNGNIVIKDLDLATTGFVPADSGLAGILNYEGTFKSDGKKLHSQGKATATKLRVVKSGAPARQAVSLDYATELDTVQHQGTLTKGDISFGQSHAATLGGTFSTRGDSLTLNSHLKGTGIPIDSLEGVLPAFGVVLPSGTKLQGGTANANLQIQGPLDRLVITGPVDVVNSKLGGFNLRSRASGLSSLMGLPSGSDLLIQALASNLKVAPEGIHADGIRVVVPSLGTVTGNGTIGANNSLSFRMRAKLQNGGGLIGNMANMSRLGQGNGEIPFRIEGTTSNPIFIPDVGAAVTNSIKAPVQGAEGLGGVLGGLFGKKGKKK